MKPRYLHDPLMERHGAGKLRVSRQGRTRTIPADETLRRIEEQIRWMYASGQIQVIDGREIFRQGAKEERERLRQRRLAVQSKLGPTSLPAGFSYELHLHGKSYRFMPRMACARDFLRAISSDPTLHRPHSCSRDLLLRLLWRFRRTALIKVGRLPSQQATPTRNQANKTIGKFSISL